MSCAHRQVQPPGDLGYAEVYAVAETREDGQRTSDGLELAMG
ncbi:hypothetical protein [Nocardia sp. CA-290969]